MPPLVRLTEQQMLAILGAAKPLARDAREGFLLEVAQVLQAVPEVGDGALHRIIMAVQRKFWVPPLAEHEPRVSRRLVAR